MVRNINNVQMHGVPYYTKLSRHLSQISKLPRKLSDTLCKNQKRISFTITTECIANSLQQLRPQCHLRFPFSARHFESGDGPGNEVEFASPKESE